jgi:hypothetical protein
MLSNNQNPDDLPEITNNASTKSILLRQERASRKFRQPSRLPLRQIERHLESSLGDWLEKA